MGRPSRPAGFAEEAAQVLRAPVRHAEAGLATSGEVTPYSRSARTPSPRKRGRAILSAGGVRLGSALQWWRGPLRVLPVGDSEPGSVFGPITGDPDLVPRCRD